MSKELIDDLLQSITLYSAGLENPDKHMARLSNAAHRIEELEREVARLKTVPMKYRRMAFNAQLQDENKALQADNARLRDAANGLAFGTDWNNGTHAKIYRPKLLEALAATPEQSLTRLRNQILEEAAKECEESCQMDDEGWGYLYAKRVRDLKIVEPE